MISLPVTIPRIVRGQDRKDADQRYSGVAAGPAERGSGTTTSVSFLAAVGTTVDVIARVAGTTPPRDGDTADVVRHCFRTVDDGLALCCPLPATEHLRLGSVIRVRGDVTEQRTQGSNHVTEIRADELDLLG